ncbi:XrtA system polysaccharide chain length determinant [Thalassotalea piscium]|uniref:Polysaccharide chain length determinant protein (PEP-CTERM system associated) n=1 Tax=Thalassotalea piscium TaxID=1230533 RepID=A0A7X0NEQ9_9GAMM|nr:XrtA system polysaccharide chain length determinant [Thalassotalea piscium]MBB6541941.1 polysaccharide chain length determinant protein (PEP-CTERM system associated) [Thalassotalea piscium]
MQEIIEQVVDYLKGVWIKRRYLIIATWLICPIGWLVVAQLDDVYESEATVFADTQSILGPLLKGITVSTDTEKQIELMVRTLLSRDNLERISRMTDLDVSARTPLEYEELIKSLKEDIIIKKTGGRQQNIFRITYEHQNPETAKNVVQSVLTVFIESMLGESRSDSDSAQRFLDSQIKEYENRLATSEAKLTDFKQKYSDVLPNQYGGYYQKLTAAKEQLKSIELMILETKTQLESARAQLPKKGDDANQANNNIVGENTIQTTYDSRIEELETALDNLLLRYTEKHPDVVEVKNRLAMLSKQREKEIEDFLNSESSEGGSYNLSQNPVTQGIMIQINQLENLIASATVRANSYQQQVTELESKIHILPEIEAELTALNRDYGITKDQYEQLLSRKETAQIAKQADESTNKINFRIIDPPKAPTEPSGPKRILFFIAVLIAGVGVGTGLSLFVSQISPVVTSGRQVSQVTGIPVFGVVSATENLGLQKWHRRKTQIFILSNMLLLSILFALVVYFSFPDAIQALVRKVM